jgi:Right handed beta helix region
VSYTLKGRIESRLVSALPALIVAFAIHRWWAVYLVAIMLAVGAALDATVYDRLISYQPAWLALPLGALELALLYGIMRAIPIHAPLDAALGLFALAWLSAQLFAHAALPRLQLTYAEAGGELGRSGVVAAVLVPLLVFIGVGSAYATRAPTIHLHGVVRGPIVVNRAETLVGGTVRGGIVIRSSHVTLRHVTTVGGVNGIDVENATHVMLDHVRVLRPETDGIHVRNSGVMVEHCMVADPAGPWVQGIDISYSIGRPMSMVSGCTIAGVREGIVTHSAEVDVMDNHVLDTTLRGIVLGEMSMDMASGNDVESAQGVGILCLDHSMCQIDHNVVADTKVDPSGDPARAGVAIEAQYYAQATVGHNSIIASPGGTKQYSSSSIAR